MPDYVWEGLNRQGQKVTGEIKAADENAAMTLLAKKGLGNAKVKPKRSGNIEIPGFKKTVPKKDVVIFTRQLSTMIEAGLPIVQCLDILQGQQKNKFFKEIVNDVKSDVESGSTFAAALKKKSDTFDALYYNLVAAGEIGGVLDTILKRLSDYIEKAEKLKSQIKSAMAYPVAVLAVAVIVVVVILVKVIPVFKDMFEGLGGQLPAPTQFVVNLSNFMKDNIILFIISLGIFVVAFRTAYKKSAQFHWSVDKALLKAPVFGDLLKKVAVARFTRTLSTMISSGVPILDGLDIVARTAGNVVIEKEIMIVKDNINQGKTMAEPLMKSVVFPNMVAQMISVGEQTGALDQMLGRIADFYDDEVDTAVATLTSLLEPIMMVVLGTVIGGLVVSMYLPIFKMAGQIK